MLSIECLNKFSMILMDHAIKRRLVVFDSGIFLYPLTSVMMIAHRQTHMASSSSYLSITEWVVEQSELIESSIIIPSPNIPEPILCSTDKG